MLNIDQEIDRKAARMAALVLAAGQASRFGGSKLLAPLKGRRVIDHVAQTVASIPFAYRLCVAAQGGVDLASWGFDMIEVEQGLPQSASLAAGVAAADRLGADAVMIVLGDMPLVPKAHLEALICAFDGDPVASSGGRGPMPPAIFGKAEFSHLKALQGDAGGRGLLKGARLIKASEQALLDIDTPHDLAVAQTLGEQAMD